MAATSTNTQSKPNSTFLGSTRLSAKVKSVVRSLSGANLSSTFKSHKQPKEKSKPSPELPEKPRGRTQSMFPQKKVKAPYYGDTNDLRHTSTDALAISLRQSFRNVGIQDVTPYDNPAMSTVSSSRHSSRSPSVNPHATPYMPTIIFTPERSSTATFTPPSSSPLAASTVSSVAHDSKISATSRGSSLPSTPMTTPQMCVDVRFDLPTFAPLPPSGPSSRPGSSLGMTVGPPYSQTRMSSSSSSEAGGGVRPSLSMPNLHSAVDRRTTKPAMAVPVNGREPNSGSQSPANQWSNQVPQVPHHSAGSANETTPATQLPSSTGVSLNDATTPQVSIIRQPPSSFIYPNLQAQHRSPSHPLPTPTRQDAEPEKAIPREAILLPPQHHRASVAPSEMSIDGPGFGKLLTGFEEVDAQLEQIVAGRSLQEQGLASIIDGQEAEPDTLRFPRSNP